MDREAWREILTRNGFNYKDVENKIENSLLSKEEQKRIEEETGIKIHDVRRILVSEQAKLIEREEDKDLKRNDTVLE